MAKTTNSVEWKVSRGTMATKEGATKMFGITAELLVNDEVMLEIHDISVKDGSKGTYMSLPQRTYKDKAGETKYSNIVYMDRESKAYKLLCDAVLAYFDEQ